MVFKKNDKRSVPNSEEFMNIFLRGLTIILIISILIFSGVYLINLNAVKDESKIYFCGDGTFYNHCSFNQPYFCKSGVLIERSSKCGCVYGYSKSEEKCISSFYNNSKTVNLNYVLRFKKNSINFIAYEDIYYYLSRLPTSINSSFEKEITRLDFELKKVNDEIQKQAILPLIVDIENMFPNNKEDQLRIAVSLVQNIPYRDIKNNFSNNNSIISKYPYQVLYDNKGSCEEKSELLVLILKELGYGTAVFYYPYENHEAVGVRCPYKYSLDNSGYCFIETTSPAIITDNKGYYLIGSELKSKPIIIPISEGASLPINFYEYYDARTFIKMREKEKLSFFNRNIVGYFKEKYGMD